MQIDTTGTGLRGYVTKGYTIEDIEKALRRAGASWRVHTGDDYNITTQIVTEIRGTTITIYDYKSTDEELADQVLGHYEWHVGGFRDQNAVADQSSCSNKYGLAHAEKYAHDLSQPRQKCRGFLCLTCIRHLHTLPQVCIVVPTTNAKGITT